MGRPGFVESHVESHKYWVLFVLKGLHSPTNEMDFSDKHGLVLIVDLILKIHIST